MNYLPWILITLVFSAFFSGMEIAFVSSNKLRIEIDKKRGYLISSFLSVFTRHPSYYIATMLIGNNVALVIYGLAMTGLLNPYLGEVVDSDSGILVLKTLISTIIILFFAEFLPKTIFRVNPNSVLRFFAFPVMFFYSLFYPITRFSTAISSVVLRVLFGVKSSEADSKSVFDRFDLNDLIGEQEDNDDNKPELKKDVKIFRNVLDFGNIRIKECIVPRNELVAVEMQESVETVIRKFKETGFSRLLVYNETIDNIIGYIHTIDMFKKPTELKNIVHSLPIVPESMPANKLLAIFTANSKSIALVVDEFGGTAGVVTLEDLIEEIFGEIEDEHDTVELVEKEIAEHHYVFSGRHEIDYLNERYGLVLPEDDNYETLAGFILHHNEDIPSTNEIIEIGKYRFRITKASGSRIKEVELWLLEA
ncbi:Hemolysin C [Salinivirga cyanobacteriivorans]|uniref:Hemolysin C n=1 Tax=Salinivirga cyanobacteriivorans TaxID=1307839 RepID=A0A0S2HZ80_9BACT|nr:hemolysin family protein [Salinivirga cyanobacteriivorans]ALO15302.1 Hemolysin C [Salinivirga cyanobacteriivorans]